MFDIYEYNPYAYSCSVPLTLNFCKNNLIFLMYFCFSFAMKCFYILFVVLVSCSRLMLELDLKSSGPLFLFDSKVVQKINTKSTSKLLAQTLIKKLISRLVLLLWISDSVTTAAAN